MIAARTERRRLTSGVAVLPVLDPVRVYEDCAPAGPRQRRPRRLTVGRSAFTQHFALFGQRLEDYDALFAEKLGLLLQLRAQERVTWSRRFRTRRSRRARC